MRTLTRSRCACRDPRDSAPERDRTLTCTGSQRVRILDVSFDLILNGDDLPEVPLTG
jgi:hypothetical protein